MEIHHAFYSSCSLFYFCSGISCVLCVLSRFRSRQMIPDQCSVLTSAKKIMIDSLSLNGLDRNTETTVGRNSRLSWVLFVCVSVLYQQMNDSGLYDYTGILGDSDDSDDDPNSKNLLAASWENLSIMDRLGLKSSVEMTEDEVESAFTQFALGFHCDQYTLTQRLQAERHERAVAEENLQRELQHTRELLQVLHERLPEADSRHMVQQMKNNLQTLEINVDNVVKTAEMLGAAHQEARVSHAVEVMSVHLDYLKKHHAEESEEMLEFRKMLPRRKSRLNSDSTDDRDLFRHSSQQPTRRRVSITLLPTQSELKHLEALFLENCKTSANATTNPDMQADSRQEVAPADSPVYSLNQEDDGDSSVFQSVTQVEPMCRHRRYSPVKPKESSFEKREAEEEEECLATLRRPLVSWRTCGCIVRVISLVFGLIMLIMLFYMQS